MTDGDGQFNMGLPHGTVATGRANNNNNNNMCVQIFIMKIFVHVYVCMCVSVRLCVQTGIPYGQLNSRGINFHSCSCKVDACVCVCVCVFVCVCLCVCVGVCWGGECVLCVYLYPVMNVQTNY